MRDVTDGDGEQGADALRRENRQVEGGHCQGEKYRVEQEGADIHDAVAQKAWHERSARPEHESAVKGVGDRHRERIGEHEDAEVSEDVPEQHVEEGEPRETDDRVDAADEDEADASVTEGPQQRAVA